MAVVESCSVEVQKSRLPFKLLNDPLVARNPAGSPVKPVALLALSVLPIEQEVVDVYQSVVEANALAI